MRSAVILMLACVLPAALAGQSPGGQVRRAQRRLSLVLEVGGSLGGPGAGLAAQLRRAGFDATTPAGCLLIFCSGPIPHPTQESPGGAVGLTVRFAVSGTLAVGAGYGTTSLGGSIGYRANDGSGFGDYVLSDWHATTAWAGGFWKPHPALRLGGGPAWYQLENVPMGITVSQAGLVGEAGVEVPADRRLFLNLAVRVHLVPAKDVEHSRTVPITLRPNWTHAVLLAGLGVRL